MYLLTIIGSHHRVTYSRIRIAIWKFSIVFDTKILQNDTEYDNESFNYESSFYMSTYDACQTN